MVVALLAGLANLNGLRNGFAYDDLHLVVENEAIHSLETLPGALVRPYWPGDRGGDMGLWRPLTTGLLGLEYSLWGDHPHPYHVVNILLHGVASGLAVLLLATLLPPLAALLGGLVFAVHPVHVEAVANVVGVAELLAAVLYLGALLVALRGEGWRRTAVVCVLYGLALLTKESAVTLPAAIVLLDASRRRLPLAELGGYLRRRGPLLAAMAATAFVLLVARARVLGAVGSPGAPLGAHLLGEIPRI